MVQKLQHNINVWDVQSQTRIAFLEDYSDPIRSIVFSSDRAKIISSCNLANKVWDIYSQSKISSFRNLDNCLSPRAISLDGTKAAGFIYHEHIIIVWDIQTRTQIAEFNHNKDVLLIKFRPDNTKIAVVTSYDYNVDILDIQSQTQVAQLNRDGAVSIIFSPDSEKIMIMYYTGNIGIWNAKTYEQIELLEYVILINYSSLITFSFDTTLMLISLNNDVLIYTAPRYYPSGQRTKAAISGKSTNVQTLKN